MEPLTEDQVRKDNPHFGSVIRLIEPIKSYTSNEFDFTHIQVVGAKNSTLSGFGILPDVKGHDAWATYLWSPSKKTWVLGAN